MKNTSARPYTPPTPWRVLSSVSWHGTPLGRVVATVSPVRVSAFHMSSSDCRQCCMVDLDWLTGRPVIVKQSKIFNGDSDTSAAARKFCCCFCQAGQELQPSDLVARIALSIAFGILQCFVRCLLDRSCRQDRIRHGLNFPNWCRFNIGRSAKRSDGPMHARPQHRPPWDHPQPGPDPPTMRPSHEGESHTPGGAWVLPASPPRRGNCAPRYFASHRNFHERNATGASPP